MVNNNLPRSLHLLLSEDVHALLHEELQIEMVTENISSTGWSLVKSEFGACLVHPLTS